ncbi:MAG TPA: GNAT family N-acetyltransferase [Chthonomonadaceae bacterium]|nr:GNAT family N-acetyltransferase [Chthonomonadaceae bacterium]
MLETERLLIRPFRPGDEDGIYELVYADPEVRKRWSGWKGGIDEFRERFKTDKLYAGANSGEFRYNALVRKAGGVLLGQMGFQNNSWTTAIHTT